MVKDTIKLQDVQFFLNDYELFSETEILEEGKEKEDIISIAKAKGINLKDNKDLAGFRTIYIFANKANKNRTRVPKEKLLKRLPTIIGKPIDIDHIRKYVVGHYIDYRYKEKEDMVIAYGVFYKSNFGTEWEQAKKLFANKKLATSYEIWCPLEKRKQLEDGTRELEEIDLAGGALLFKEKPAFEDAKVLEVAMKNIEESNKELIFASEYKDNDIIVANNPFLESIKQNAEKLQAEKETQLKQEELKKQQEIKEKKKEEPKQQEPLLQEVKPETKIIVCSNCKKDIDILTTPEISQGLVKCPACFSLVNRQTGEMRYPPQIMDFNTNCPSCGMTNWRLLSNLDKEAKLQCMSCSKQFNIKFKTKSSDLSNIASQINFLYSTYATCIQCRKVIPIEVVSKVDSTEVHCPRCGLKFPYNLKKSNPLRQIEEICLVEEPQKSSEIIEEKNMDNKDNVQTPVDTKLEQPIVQATENLDEAKKLKKQNRGNVVFPSDSSKVKDNADHFPINDIKQARNALARVAQFDKVPDWFNGTLQECQNIVRETVKKEYPSIDVTMEDMMADEELAELLKKQKRGNVIFPYESPKVKDNKDHFPINNIRQARNALARVAQYDSVPDWYDGTLEEVQKKVRQTVKKAYPTINVTENSEMKVARKATKKIIALKKANKQLVKSSEEEKIKLLDSITKIEKEAAEKIAFYKANSVEIASRRDELGKYGTDLSDQDILDEKKYINAKLVKANASCTGDSVGNKGKDDDYYSDARKQIDNKAFGRN